jgi:hypothetical protein
MTITEDFNIWSRSNDVPLVVISYAQPEEKEFQVWVDSIVPLVELYEVGVTVTTQRRRVFIF